MRALLALTLFFLFTASGCSGRGPDQATVPGRWYTEAQVESGESLYQSHCAVCHGADGSATADWRTLNPSGHYPPPPLNGSAHTWHHPLGVLKETIANGGIAFGGVMPGFADTLSRDDRLAVIAWFQSLWYTEEVEEIVPIREMTPLPEIPFPCQTVSHAVGKPELQSSESTSPVTAAIPECRGIETIFR